MADWIMGDVAIRSNSVENIRNLILRFWCNGREEVLKHYGINTNNAYFPRTNAPIYDLENLDELLETIDEIEEPDGDKAFRIEFSVEFGYNAKSSLMTEEPFYFFNADGTRVEGLISLSEACIAHNTIVEIFTRHDSFEERLLVDQKGERITYEARNIEIDEDEFEHETYRGGFTDERDWPWII